MKKYVFIFWRYQDETDMYSSRIEPDERRRGRERGRDRREKCRDLETGRLSQRQSAISLHTQVRSSNCPGLHEKCWHSQWKPSLFFFHLRHQILVKKTDLWERRTERTLSARRHRWAVSVLPETLKHTCSEENGSFLLLFSCIMLMFIPSVLSESDSLKLIVEKKRHYSAVCFRAACACD